MASGLPAKLNVWMHFSSLRIVFLLGEGNIYKRYKIEYLLKELFALLYLKKNILIKSRFVFYIVGIHAKDAFNNSSPHTHTVQ